MKQKFREMQSHMQEQMNQQQDFHKPVVSAKARAQNQQREIILILKRSNRQLPIKTMR